MSDTENGDEDFLCRVMERDLRLPSGTLTLWDARPVCRGCVYCRPPATNGRPKTQEATKTQ
jgi:hypothetical protein